MSSGKIIIPPPRQVEYNGDPLILGISGKAFYTLNVTADCDNTLVTSAVSFVQKKLASYMNTEPEGPVVITLETADPPAGIKNAAQGYSIVCDENSIKVTGYGPEGLFYAAITFNHYLSFNGNRIIFPRMNLTDYPDLKTRGHFVESRYGSNLMDLDDWKQVVDNMAQMKMNQLVISVYGCWCVQYDGRVSEYMYIPVKAYPKLQTPVVTRYFSPSAGWYDHESLPPMFEQDFLGDLIAYGKTRAVNVFPLVNSYGHNTLIPNQYPEVSALEEDGSPSKTGFCTSNPKTYELLFTLYDEIIDRYLKPNQVDSFHMGMDEVWDGIALNAEDIYRSRSTWCRCSECKKKTHIELYIDHAIKLIIHLKEHGMRNIYMYNDMLKYGNADALGEGSPAKMFASRLKELKLDEVTVMDCWTYSESYDGLSFKSTLPELGLRRIVKPWNGYYHWTLLTHPLNNIFMMLKMAYDDDAEGLLSYSAWDKSYQRNNSAEASFAWNFKGTGTLDAFKETFAKAFGGDRPETAIRAFKALEASVNPFNGKYSFMFALSYYFYSYVSEGAAYPRRFPGEAIANLLSNRNANEITLAEIEVSASEAAVLFDELAADTTADYILAARFAYEAKNYLCLIRDYKALLEMHDLASSLPDADSVYRIRSLAAERKKARLGLMALFEQTKEHYLLASHMRNHTIFMQYFADLEGYLTYTSPDSVKLDFRDNTHFASEAFMKLR